MIITFINQKGGVGKSTISLSVASALAEDGFKVLLIDADDQDSISDWASARRIDPPFTLRQLLDPKQIKAAITTAVQYDFTIIDSPPRSADMARACIIAADLVLMPVEPGSFSKWASDKTVQQIRKAQEIKENLKCGFVISRKIGNTVLGREARRMVAGSGISVLDTEISSLIQFPESQTLAQTIFEYAPYSDAAQQITKLTKEIREIHEQDIRRQSGDAQKTAHA